MENVLIIYKVADNRIVDFQTKNMGIPVPDTDSTDWDSTAWDFVVGVPNYADEDIWDTTSGELTDAACADIGLDTTYKSKVLKDVEIDIDAQMANVDYMNDIKCVVSGSTVTLSVSKLSASYRPSKLAITFNEVSGGGISDQGVDPYNGLPTWSAVTDLDNDYLNITVRKFDNDDNPMTDATDNDAIVLRVSGGKIFGNSATNLVNGVATLYWQPPLGSVTATATVLPTGLYTPGQHCIPASESIQMLTYSMP